MSRECFGSILAFVLLGIVTTPLKAGSVEFGVGHNSCAAWLEWVPQQL